MFTDREIQTTASRDQNQTSIVTTANDIALFYRTLVDQRVPAETAGKITRTFAALILSGGCGCEGEGG